MPDTEPGAVSATVVVEKGMGEVDGMNAYEAIKLRWQEDGTEDRMRASFDAYWKQNPRIAANLTQWMLQQRWQETLQEIKRFMNGADPE